MNNHGFSRIVLATDGSEQAEAAEAVAASFARPSEAKVRVAHIWNLEVRHRHGVWDVETRGEAARLISQAVNRLRSMGIDADGEVSRADTAHIAGAVAEVARDFHADLVVLGSRGLTDWQSLTQHGVSHNVLRVLDCPVMFVRGECPGFKPQRILVAVAGGDDIEPIVRATLAAASFVESTVRVVHVAQAFIGAMGYSYVEPEDEISATVKTTTAMLTEAGVPAEAIVAEPGPVARSVAAAAAAWQADVIVIGSSRMADLPSMLFGSVTHDLLKATDKPVLVAERVHA